MTCFLLISISLVLCPNPYSPFHLLYRLPSPFFHHLLCNPLPRAVQRQQWSYYTAVNYPGKVKWVRMHFCCCSAVVKTLANLWTFPKQTVFFSRDYVGGWQRIWGCSVSSGRQVLASVSCQKQQKKMEGSGEWEFWLNYQCNNDSTGVSVHKGRFNGLQPKALHALSSRASCTFAIASFLNLGNMGQTTTAKTENNRFYNSSQGAVPIQH